MKAHIIEYEKLDQWRAAVDSTRLVVTNGCFDLLHLGHMQFLEQCARLGDCVMVGVNSDQGVRQLKGTTRPIYPAAIRAEMLTHVRAVDYVCVFPAHTAEEFLKRTKPDVWVKGYRRFEDLNKAEKREVLCNGGMTILTEPIDGLESTTEVIARICSGAKAALLEHRI